MPEAGADYYEPRERAARRSPAAAVSVESHRRVAPRVRLHAARLRQQHEDPVSGALPAARRRRERDELDQAGARQPHPRQPHRRRQGQADDRRHGHRLRDQAGRDTGAGPDRQSAGSQRLRRCVITDLDPDDRRAVTARSPIASTAPWRACRWAAGRRCRSRRRTSTSLPGSARSARRSATSTSRRR